MNNWIVQRRLHSELMCCSLLRVSTSSWAVSTTRHCTTATTLRMHLLFSFQFIIIMSGVNYTPLYYGDYTFPKWADGIGWLMVCVPIAAILSGAIIRLIRCKGNVSTCRAILVTLIYDTHSSTYNTPTKSPSMITFNALTFIYSFCSSEYYSTSSSCSWDIIFSTMCKCSMIYTCQRFCTCSYTLLHLSHTMRWMF